LINPEQAVLRRHTKVLPEQLLSSAQAETAQQFAKSTNR